MECKEQDCKNKTISLSDFCGDHTNNDTYLKVITAQLENHEIHQMCNISAVELVPEKLYEISEKIIEDGVFIDANVSNFVFKNTQFISCQFSDLELHNCSFLNCTFSDGTFDQLSITEGIFDSCSFEQCDWDNCTFFEKNQLSNNTFTLNKLTNLLITDSVDGTENTFQQCIFVLGSINQSNFNNSCFLYTEFIKTSLAYCSFRNSKFLDINHDFDQTGAPLACDFFGAQVDTNIQELSEAHFSNFHFENYSEFVRSSIEQLLILNHPNYMTELSYFLYYLINNGENIGKYKGRVLSQFKSLYDRLLQENSIEMIGSLIQTFTQFPDEITQSSFLLPLQSEGLSNTTSKLIITFKNDGMNFGTLVSINGVLAIVEHALFGKDKDRLITKRIQSGSIVQEIIANTDKVVVYAGVLYAFSKAIFSLVKSDAEIKQITVETQKTELEVQKLQKELDSDAVKERSEKYVEVIRSEEISSVDINLALENFLKSDEGIKHIKKLDKQFKIEKIEVIVKE